ncbi:MAG TPA: WYL domain-containing protein [Candidatus Limnocylindria bacterium]|nr:WYL domain-containing protein [Candidatus Limnocylindria bacterium]
MASASDQLTRLLTLIPWLVAHPGVTKEEAARTFSITTQQLERDLELAACAEVGRDTLASLDIDYWDDEITVIDAQSVDRPLELRIDEAVTLLVGLRALAAVPGLADRQVVDQALAKVEGAIGSAAGTVTDAGLHSVPDVVTEAVHTALTEGRRLHLSYWTPARDQVTERDVDPMRLVSVGTSGYLQGWCHTSEAVRTFRLDRIVTASVLDTPATPPPQAELVDVAHAGGTWDGGPGDVLVTLDLAPQVRWVVDYHPVEDAVETADGGLRVTLRTPELAWARRLVLRLAGGASVVSPPELAEEVRRTASAALLAYR